PVVRTKAAGGVHTAKQAPRRPGIAPALGLRAGNDVSHPTQTKREMAVFKMKWKLLLAGSLVAVAVGGFALRFAYATQGQGVTVTTIAGPAEVDELNITAQSNSHGIKILTRGEWVTRVVHHKIVPGGHTGWHSHPGPVFVMVIAGTLTKYDADDLDEPRV